MSLVASDFPDDAEVVLAEVIAHLGEIDGRRLTDPGELAAAWSGVRHCDAAVLEVLTPAERISYESITQVRRADRKGRRSVDPTIRMSAARLHVAIHRRLVLLQDMAV